MKKMCLTAVAWALLPISVPAALSEDATSREVARTYADIVFAAYSDSLRGAQSLEVTVTAFLKAPSQEGLDACRAAWTRARQPYLTTECFRYYGGPIDDASGPEGLLNSWPVDESWLESGAAERPGLIENTAQFPRITPELMRGLNQQDGEKNVCAGWHGIEFLLWGQDHDPEGPGQRPFTDFHDAALAPRRCAALQAMCALLVQNLQTLADAWEPRDGATNYRTEFLDTKGAECVRRILTGMIFLTGQEMAGERMNVALETRSQEEEPSCFSDTTTQDLRWNLEGIRSLWQGTYRCAYVAEADVSGHGLKEVAAATDPALSASINQALDRATMMAKGIPPPFDRAILGSDDSPGRRAVIESMESLEFLSSQLKTLADKLALEITNQSASPDG